MAVNFDQLPLYDPILHDDGQHFSPIWSSFLSTFSETIGSYLTQYGIIFPPVTTQERDSIQKPINGQAIYNTTLKKFQGYENGAWVNFI